MLQKGKATYDTLQLFIAARLAAQGFGREMKCCLSLHFYCYLYPEPEGYKTEKIQPAGAYYNTTLGEFILPYSEVQQAEDPGKLLLEFLNSTYHAGAELAKWDREILED